MILEFLAPGFEEIEALAPADILRRAGLDIRTAAVTGGGTVVSGAHNIPVTADLTEEEALALAETEKIEMIILPGGMPGAANLDASDTVQFFLDKAVAEGAYIASICAAPMIPGKRGLLKGRRATCYPGFEQYLDGAEYTAGRVETDGKMITSCGMGAAVEFGLALTAILKGEPAAETIASAVFAK